MTSAATRCAVTREGLPEFLPSGFRPAVYLVTDENGTEVLMDWRGMAYDACFKLGQEVRYASTPDNRLPEPVRAVFWLYGPEVMRMANLGWLRARKGWNQYGGLSLRDSLALPKRWCREHNKADTCRAKARPYRTEADPRYLPVVETEAPAMTAEEAAKTDPLLAAIVETQHEHDGRRAGKSERKAESYTGPDLRPKVALDLKKVKMTTSDIARLSSATRSLLRSVLPTESDYKGKALLDMPRILASRSKATKWEQESLAKRLNRELGKGVPTVASFGRKRGSALV